jgi:hypothetical protein
MWYDENDDAHFVPASTQDLIREQAYYDGHFCPEKAWLLSDFDTWERNPHYKGEPVPHPDADLADNEEAQAEVPKVANWVPFFEGEDDLPF